MDMNKIIKDLQENTQPNEILAQMRTMSGSRRNQAPVVSSSTAQLLEQAAKAAERGDTAKAAQLAEQVSKTPDGKVLAQQLATLFSKKESDT